MAPLVSPPLPASLVDSFFSALDENQDGHVDFKELSCGVSAACRGPETERQKFCFKIFDSDRDGVLNEAEVRVMVESMVEVKRQTATSGYLLPDKSGVDQMVSDILDNHGGSGDERVVAQVIDRYDKPIVTKIKCVALCLFPGGLPRVDSGQHVSR